MLSFLSRLPRPYSFLRPFCTSTPSNESIIEQIAAGNPEAENKLRVLMLEIELRRQDGRNAPEPDFMKKKHWEALLALNSHAARAKYLTHLFKINMSDNNRKMKKLKKREEYLEMLSQKTEDNNPYKYDLSHNSMFLRIYEKSMNEFYNRKSMHAMVFGQKLVLDCSYDKYMIRREAENAANQVTHLFAANRMHKEPFDLHFCNVNKDSSMFKQLHRNIPTLLDADFPVNIHQDSYLNHFPKERLVYLTPHCRNDLVYDPDDIYIVGCMVDKVHTEPVSLGKAKENKLRMAKLPLDRYLQWGEGSGKSLTINQMCDIMLDLSSTQNWEYSLRHVPRRKLIPTEPVMTAPNDSSIDKFFNKPNQKRPLKSFRLEKPLKKNAFQNKFLKKGLKYYDN